jgi:hypothetical protein
VGEIPRTMWALLAVAVCLRLAALTVFHGPDLVSASESGLTAANWVAGRGYTFDFYGYRAANPLQSFMPPLFTAMVAACLVTPWPEIAFSIVQVVLSSLTVLLVYLIATRLAGRTVGLVGAVLTAIYPPFLILVDQNTLPVLGTFLLALWMWTSIRLVADGGWRRAALAGLALGLNILSRPSSIGLLAVMLLGLWLRAKRAPERERSGRPKGVPTTARPGPSYSAASVLADPPLPREGADPKESGAQYAAASAERADRRTVRRRVEQREHSGRPQGWGARFKSWWRPAIVMVAAMGLTVVPWLTRDLLVHRRFVWISTNGGFTFWNGNNPFTTGSAFDVEVADLAAYSGEVVAVPDGVPIVQVKPYPLPLELRGTVATLDEVALDRDLYGASLAFIQAHPRRWLGLLAQKLVSLWWFRPNVGLSSGFYQESWVLPYQILYVGVLIAACAGLILSFQRWREYVVMYGLFAYLTLVYVAYNVITRYRWEMEPYLLVLAALALVTGWRQASPALLRKAR